MEPINIISICILLVAVLSVAGIKIYKVYKKNNKKFNIPEFIDEYGDNIIAILKDVVKLITLDESKYSSKEEYEKDIIRITIDEIKENYKNFGIDAKILSIADSKALSEAIYDILHGNAINIFSVLDDEVIAANPGLFDDSVLSSINK